MTEEEHQAVRAVKARMDPKMKAAIAYYTKMRLKRNIPVIRDDAVRPITQTQTRLLKLLGLPVPPRGPWARQMLRLAGYEPSGIPRGMIWQQIKTLTDKEWIERATLPAHRNDR